MLASQLSWLTGGEDGRSVPRARTAAARHRCFGHLFGIEITGRTLTYYIVFVVSARCCSSPLLRIVNSPFGRVLQAIRENPFRAEALGYRTVIHRTLANVHRGGGRGGRRRAERARGCATPGRTPSLSFAIMLDILLIVVIGGMGTDVRRDHRRHAVHPGAELPAGADGRRRRRRPASGLPILPQLLHPDRWLLWLGLLFIASVYFFPTGIVGKLRGKSG